MTTPSNRLIVSESGARSVGGAWLAGAALSSTGCDRGIPKGTALTSVSEVRHLRLADASRGYPVRLRGIATYYHAPSTSLVLQSDVEGVLVDVSQIEDPTPSGREIEVVGVTGIRDSSVIGVGTAVRISRTRR